MKSKVAILLFAVALFAFGTTHSYADAYGRADEGDKITYTVDLLAGQVAEFSAVGDDDALDLDLYAHDPYGRLVDRDILDDAVPVLAFVAPVTGTYEITLVIVDTFAGRWIDYVVRD